MHIPQFSSLSDSSRSDESLLTSETTLSPRSSDDLDMDFDIDDFGFCNTTEEDDRCLDFDLDNEVQANTDENMVIDHNSVSEEGSDSDEFSEPFSQ